MTSASAVHSAVVRTSALLDDVCDTWCVLRGDLALARPGGDIDILVSHDAVAAIETHLTAEGLVAVRDGDWSNGTTYILYDGASGVWLKLDISPTLRMRRIGELPADLTTRCLARRERRQGVNRASPGDEFWALFLHCVLNRESFPDHAAARLEELAAAASSESELARYTMRTLGIEVTPAGAVAIARGAAPPVPGTQGPHLGLRRAMHVRAAFGAQLRRGQRLWSRRRRGIVIRVDVAGSGVREALRGYPIPARVIAAPLPLAHAVSQYHRLQGRFVVLAARRSPRTKRPESCDTSSSRRDLATLLWERHANHLRSLLAIA